MEKNKTKTPKPRAAKQGSKTKKIVISVVAAVLVVAIGCSLWYYYGHRNTDPVNVYDFMNIGMTDYWGDSKESYGPVTTDRIQTVNLSTTQTVTEVFVQQGDTVKKGDPLLAFDTTLTDLALEKKRLEVEKMKIQLENAQDELTRIKNLKPMVINPKPDPKPTPTTNPGTKLNGEYDIISKKTSDGSSQQKALVIWLSQDTQIDDDLLELLRAYAEKLQNKTPITPTEPTEPSEPSAPTEPSATTEPTETTPPTETTAPTEPSNTTEPTETTAPSETEETSAAVQTIQTKNETGTSGSVREFYIVLKVTSGDTSYGDRVIWQGMKVAKNDNGSFSFSLFDAFGVADPVVKPTTPSDNDNDNSGIDYGSGYTASEIASMRNEQEKTIKDLKFSIKMAESEYKIMQTETADGKVYAQFDGTVVSLLTEQEAKDQNAPMIKVSDGGGFYVTASVGEFDRDTLQIGQEVTVTDWNSGMTYTGTIQKIGDYPTDNSYFSSSENPDVSYYPMTVYVDGSADLQPGFYVNVQYSADTESQGIYLQNPFLRTENGKSYVYVRGEDGKLERRDVVTGKTVWGSYVEIRSGLSVDDKIAFPYGKNVKEGAETVDGDLSDLYNY